MKPRPRIVQHVVGADGGGPLAQLRLLLASRLSVEFQCEVVSQEIACGGINLPLIRTLASRMRKVNPDLVHVRGLHSGGFHAVAAARLARAPRILVSVHGSTGDSIRQGRCQQLRQWVVHQVLESLTLRWADGVICVCQDAARKPFLRRHARRFLGIVPNGIPVRSCAKREESARRALGFRPEDVVAFFAGRLVRDKGLFILAAALRQLEEAGVSQPRLMLAGDGPDRAELEKAFGPIVKSGRVTFLGHGSDLSGWHAASDFFVFPTLHENLSNAVLEAMHAGRAVLATQVGGNPELVMDGVTGRLIPAGDVEALAEGLQWFVWAREARDTMGAAGRQRIETEFSLDRTVEKLGLIYQKMLEDKPGSGHSL